MWAITPHQFTYAYASSNHCLNVSLLLQPLMQACNVPSAYCSVCLFCFVQLLTQFIPLALQLCHLNLLHLLLFLSAIHF